MTTIMKSDSFELGVNDSGIDVTSHEDRVRLYVPLTAAERRTLAAALDPDRGGQWTREDLLSVDEAERAYRGPYPSVRHGLDAVLNVAVTKLNAHHPKPGVQWCANKDEVDDALHSELMGMYGQRDRLRILLASAADERDAAVARAEKAEDRVRALEAAPARSTWCPKILLELLRAQSIYSPDEVTGDAIQTLGRVIAQHRPVGPDGKHGDRHTASCGCEDLGAVYPTVEVQARATVADTKLEDEAVSHAYWVANQLGCHVDDLDELTLVEMSKRVVEKAERERDEADRRTAAAEADRDRWKLHHDRVDGQWAKAEREVTRLRGTGVVTKADIEKAVSPYVLDRHHLDTITIAVWAKVSGDDPAVDVVRESDVQAVKVERRGDVWNLGSVSYDVEAYPLDQRIARAERTLAQCFAIRRAIEAEKAVDPVEDLATQIDTAARAALREVFDQLGVAVDAALADEVVASVSGESRRIAAHVLGREADQ